MSLLHLDHQIRSDWHRLTCHQPLGLLQFSQKFPTHWLTEYCSNWYIRVQLHTNTHFAHKMCILCIAEALNRSILLTASLRDWRVFSCNTFFSISRLGYSFHVRSQLTSPGALDARQSSVHWIWVQNCVCVCLCVVPVCRCHAFHSLKSM